MNKMNTLRSVAHLQRELGDGLFNTLISSDNTEAVRRFVQKLAEDTLPKEMTIGGRTYELIVFLREDEKRVRSKTLFERAAAMNAILGEGDGRFILKHQDDIPSQLRGKVSFVFPDWNDCGEESVNDVSWNGSSWTQRQFWYPGVDWGGWDRLLRRK